MIIAHNFGVRSTLHAANCTDCTEHAQCAHAQSVWSIAQLVWQRSECWLSSCCARTGLERWTGTDGNTSRRHSQSRVRLPLPVLARLGGQRRGGVASQEPRLGHAPAASSGLWWGTAASAGSISLVTARAERQEEEDSFRDEANQQGSIRISKLNSALQVLTDLQHNDLPISSVQCIIRHSWLKRNQN